MLDGKAVGVAWLELSSELLDSRNAGHARAALEFDAQGPQLLGAPERVDLHAPISPIHHVAAHADALGHELREKTIAHSLHHSGNEEALRLGFFVHDRRGSQILGPQRGILAENGPGRRGGCPANVAECGAVLQNRATRKNGLLAGVLLLFLTATAGAQKPAAKAPQPSERASRGVEIVQNNSYTELHVDGKPFFVHSATFHYFRIPDDLWEASLDRYRALGINTIDLLIPWNWHEPQDGTVDFDGHTHPRRDLRRLLRLIAEKRFRLVARPGPVVGADWRHGGYPEWLLERPEYGMSEQARREGRYPPLVELGERDPEGEAAGWLENATHMERASRWLAAVAWELEPYSAQKTLEIEVPNEKSGRPEKQEISGPLLFVQLDATHTSASGAGGPDYRRYAAALGQMLIDGGLDAPVAINAGEVGLAIPLAAANAGMLGEWFLRPAAGTTTTRTLSAWDVTRIESTVERMQAQTALPPIVVGYQAGWLTPADEARPAEVEPAVTLMGSRLLMGFGARGLNYFPLQDAVTPAGYDVPWANRFHRWDAALEPGGTSRPRARPVEQNGQLLASAGELLAASHRRADFGLLVTSTDDARENWAAWIAAMKLGRVAQLAGLAGEWLHVEADPVEHLLRHTLVILPTVPGVERQEFSEKAQGLLVEYVRRGGTLAVLAPRPGGAVLGELWSREREPQTTSWRFGAGRVIELEKDFYSWVELQENLGQTEMRGEAIPAVQTLQNLLARTGSRPVLRRDVNMDATGELVVTQLVSNAGSGWLGARTGGEGILSVTNLSDETAEETIEVLSPRANAKAPGGGYLTLGLQVPPRESLLLPLHHSLCTAVGPREKCSDEILASGAELRKVERDGHTLQLALHVPGRAILLLRLEKQPGRVSLDEFRPEAVWTAEERELRVVVPRGAWPDFERVLRIRLPYTPHVPEAPKKPDPGRRDYDVRVVDAVRLPLGDDASLPSYPPLVMVDPDGNGQILVEAMNYDDLGRDVNIKVEGPVRGDDDIGLSAKETRQTEVKLRGNAPAAPGSPVAANAGSVDGLLRGEWEARSERDRRRWPIVFAAIPAEGAAAYRFDFDRDGAPEWVLENSGIRLILSPEYGGRALALVDKTSGGNFLTSVGGMMSQAAGGEPAALPREAYAAEWQKDEKQTSLRLSADLRGGRLGKTIRLPDATTAEVEYEWSATGDPPESLVVMDSVPAVPGEGRSTRFCWKPWKESPEAPREAAQESEPECVTFAQGRGAMDLPEAAREMEVRTPGRGTLKIEWDAGGMTVEMKQYSAMLRLEFPAPAASEQAARHRMRYKLVPAN